MKTEPSKWTLQIKGRTEWTQQKHWRITPVRQSQSMYFRCHPVCQQRTVKYQQQLTVKYQQRDSGQSNSLTNKLLTNSITERQVLAIKKEYLMVFIIQS